MSAFFFPFFFSLCFYFLCLFCFLFLIVCLLNANTLLLAAVECKFIFKKKLIGLKENAENFSKIGYLWLKLNSNFSREVILIPYPIDEKVSLHFLLYHFPSFLRVWGGTTKLLIFKFTKLFLAIQCVVLSLQTVRVRIFFSWKHLRRIGVTLSKDFFRMRLTRRCLNLGPITQRIPHDTTKLLG